MSAVDYRAITVAAATKCVRPPASVEAVVAEIKDSLGEKTWLPSIYRHQILPLRTRAHSIRAATKGATVAVQHTLLGIELKVGHHRLSCPDLATARYLAVFARIGCSKVAVPYDITQISRLADELESAWHRMVLLVGRFAEERSRTFLSRARATIMADARREIEQAGAGSPIPQFNQNTKQRQQHATGTLKSQMNFDG